jgi:hypothetical protein
MPAKSAKQYRFMQMMAHNPRSKKEGGGIGPSSAVAREFIEKTPPKKRSQFAKERG